MTFDHFLKDVLNVVAPLALTAITGIVAVLAQQFRKWVNKKVSNDALRTSLLHIDDVVQSVVHDLELTVRPALTEGKLTEEHKKLIKEMAIKRISELLLPETKKAFSAAGLELEKFLSAKIESVLFKIKNS